ncbi:unnamed protein product [marine sediment metagenome]|uniref:Uncharacterized protein n=1 Tax=marine sediment metagenome TaxID=412755 RepID=X0VHL9_9ZZZZ
MVKAIFTEKNNKEKVQKNMGLMPMAGRLFCKQNVWVRLPQYPH